MENATNIQEKHIKYMKFYDNKNVIDDEYWGIGIENESYLMFENLVEVDKLFALNNHKRERYSINYWINFKREPLIKALQKLPKKIKIPIYINSYFFLNTDYFGEPTKTYTKAPQPNNKFSGLTVDQYLRNRNPLFNKLFENNMIYDGDSIEFTTFNFYKTTVQNVVNELQSVKKTYLNEINYELVENKPSSSSTYLFKNKIIFPPFNYGFVKFLSNMNNLGICNNGTYHINITLPTELNENNNIKNPETFEKIHSNAIRMIQWMEPFLIALYGSPDILSLLDDSFSGGSLRLMMSRYIGLATYDSTTMKKGKILNDFDYKTKDHYFNKLHANSPYIPPETIGYDFNYSKFKKHGIELRIFDYFPEDYLEDIINFIILLCQFSIDKNIPESQTYNFYNEFVIDCIKYGSTSLVTVELYNYI